MRSTLTPSDVMEYNKRAEWAKAKGHLEAMLGTYHGETDSFELVNELVEEFIKAVQSHL